MQHRIERLEEWPPRVELLEKAHSLLKQEMHATRVSVEDLRKETQKTNILVTDVRDLVNRLFWTGAGVVMACSVIWAVAAVAWKYIKISAAP